MVNVTFCVACIPDCLVTNNWCKCKGHWEMYHSSMDWNQSIIMIISILWLKHTLSFKCTECNSTTVILLQILEMGSTFHNFYPSFLKQKKM